MTKCMFDSNAKKCGKVAVKKVGNVTVCKRHFDLLVKHRMVKASDGKDI